jgi:hypothetical protein
MAALTTARAQVIERWTHRMFVLTAGQKTFRGGALCGVPTTGRVRPAADTAGFVPIGYSDEDVDATSAEKSVSVDLGIEIEVRWLEQDGSIADANTFAVCYWADDQTVKLTGTAIAGRIWQVDAARGVAVQLLRPTT